MLSLARAGGAILTFGFEGGGGANVGRAAGWIGTGGWPARPDWTGGAVGPGSAVFTGGRD